MRCNACRLKVGCSLVVAVSAAVTGLIGLGLNWTCLARFEKIWHEGYLAENILNLCLIDLGKI